jgi:hypothetical protein
VFVIEMVRHRPGDPRAACPTEIAVHCTGGELHAPLAQIVPEQQAQHFAYLNIDNLSPGIPIPSSWQKDRHYPR